MSSTIHSDTLHKYNMATYLCPGAKGERGWTGYTGSKGNNLFV